MVGEKDYSMVCVINYLTVVLKYSRWNVKKFGPGKVLAMTRWMRKYVETIADHHNQSLHFTHPQSRLATVIRLATG